MSVVIVVPVLRRPHRVEPLLASLRAATPEPYDVLFMCTLGDHAEIDTVEAAGTDFLAIDWAPGDFSRKINIAFAATTHEYLFLAADDLRFHPGWLTAAFGKMIGQVGVVGTNDLGNPRVTRGEHATHSLISRVYVDERGTIDESGKVLHEGYRHCFCDDELRLTAQARDAWAFAGDSHVEHLHPNWRKGSHDDVYELGNSSFNADRRLFRSRERMWT